jgi:O-methyltransferase
MSKLRNTLKKILPAPVYILLSVFGKWDNLSSALAFLTAGDLPHLSFAARMRLLSQVHVVGYHLPAPHANSEILAVMRSILALPPGAPGVVVEAGCFQGASTVKLSLAADLVGRNLVVFDSFEGMPENEEPRDKDDLHGDPRFTKGKYSAGLEDVKANVAKYGRPGRCRFVKGWFSETMPLFHEPVSVVFLDVDLAASTRTCLEYLYPLMETGGTLYSHDGRRPLVVDVFNDETLWADTLGTHKPHIPGLGEKRLVRLVKGN